MDLFAITCTTCKSRLRVRDPAAVGQILACPKCGGMVMVKPPPVWTDTGDQKSDMPTATEVETPRVPFDQTVNNSAFDVLEELLSDAPPKVQPPAVPAAPRGAPQSAAEASAASPIPAPSAPKPRFVGGPPARRSATPPQIAVKPNATPPAAAVQAFPPSQPAPKTNLPKATAPATKSWKAAEKTNGASLPAVVFQSAATTPAKELPPPPSEMDLKVSPTASERGPTSPRKFALPTIAYVAIGMLLAFGAVTIAIHYMRPANVRKPIAKQRGTTPASRSPTTNEEATALAASTISEELNSPAVTSPIPTEQTPNQPDPVSAPSPAAATSARVTEPLELVKEEPKKSPAVGGDALAKFDRLLGGADPIEKTAPPAPPPVEIAPDPGPPRVLAPRPPARQVDLPRRLADSLPGIETAGPGTPLADFVQLLSDVSTIPITLDLPLVPATATSLVSVKLANTTVGGALSEALKPLGLEHVAIDDQLVIRRAEPAKLSAITHSVKNLVGTDEQQLTDLADLLKAVVEPASWNEDSVGIAFQHIGILSLEFHVDKLSRPLL